MQQISVGKNVVRILNREFPIDSDLSMINIGRGDKAWRVNSIRQSHVFTPIVDEEVSAEAFREYNVALGQSKAFSSRGKLRQLFDKKEEGVKVIPGHGVFILPSKMVVQQRGQRKVYIRVFGGTELAKDFWNTDYKLMVLEAANYYFDNLRFLTDEVNKNLWYPVKYNRNHQLLVEDLLVPDGVFVRTYDNGHVGVGYSSVEDGGSKWMGTARNQSELDSLLHQADEIRRKEQARAAMYRFVNPSYVPLSLYMRRV
ncbi:hypothetical protein AVU38_gp186 [Ralstonia phage RSL2]|uniref:Uncharacterized protein n=1 Tax=Ralstonia phage RSL2 TaxID=1585840 RepID=A0A0A8J9N3_9CAUD|nr:hypothetical protein AVU38_gp186 [Ralstonia phage RSL2]BAQ02714.1 hypothetical protein [Ralstonia phage RSL2]